MSFHPNPERFQASDPRSPAASEVAERASRWGFGLLLIIGSVLFLFGGRAHPPIVAGADAGVDEFFRLFAETVHRTHGWQGMHMLILIGPMLWAVAAPALVELIRPSVFVRAAQSALILSGALWAVAFALDGFGAPVFAEAILQSSSAELSRSMTTAFEANAVMMSRLGLVSWVAGGLGMASLGASLLPRPVRNPWRMAVGVSGILIGAWPLVAALHGEYAGGPFVSRFWMANALAAGLWYIALALQAVPGSRLRGSREQLRTCGEATGGTD